MKTRRAEIIEACAEVARRSSLEIIAHMPRMAEFYRKRTNEQLRAARAACDVISVNDAKAKLEHLRWVDSWTSSSATGSWSYGSDARVAGEMAQHLSVIGYSLRYLVRAYESHPQFRPEWSARDA